MARITTPTVTPSLTSTDTVARIEVGTTVHTTDGGIAEYVIALSAIAQYDVVAIMNSSSATGASTAAAPISTTNAATSSQVGFAQTAIAAGSYGWVYIKPGNNCRANVLISCQPAVPLYTTATAGSLDDTIVTAGYVEGILAMSSAASASAVPIVGGFCLVKTQGAPG